MRVHTCGIELVHILILLNSGPFPDPVQRQSPAAQWTGHCDVQAAPYINTLRSLGWMRKFDLTRY